jgi:hypothetical protein
VRNNCNNSESVFVIISPNAASVPVVESTGGDAAVAPWIAPDVDGAISATGLFLEGDIGDVLPGLHGLAHAVLLLGGETLVYGVGQVNFLVIVAVPKRHVFPGDVFGRLVRRIRRFVIGTHPERPRVRHRQVVGRQFNGPRIRTSHKTAHSF